MTLIRSLTLSCLLLSASAAFADDRQFVGVYELNGSYADAKNTSLADSTIKLTVQRERGRLTFTRTSAIPTGPHQSLLPVSWESKRVRNRGKVNNDQGSYHHLEVTYSVTVREVRGASGALNNDRTSGRLTKKDLVLNYYFPADDLTSVGELGTNTIEHNSPPEWETLKSFGNKTAAAPPAATPPATSAPIAPRTPIAPRSQYDRDGFDRFGYDRYGFGRLGFDRDGYDRLGFDRNGYNRYGMDRAGFNRAGFDRNGFNRYGYNRYGYDRYGFDRYGFNRHGYNRSGFDRYGNHFQNRGNVRGYVPQPGIVIGTNRGLYPNGSNNYRRSTTTYTPNGTITRSSTYRSNNYRSNSGGGISFGRGGVRINIPLGR